ncbi:hypothetical protein Leryth_011269 [Lithospermum erythrorhizon]|nr:hypothetical protein Leryth_011269 [Lithospermum erythrorhizon]
MAGNIENSTYTINFQADPLHSGSISFGRFENESLCWERRSSFSHNRYLEDAEKYSRPGSVNEKKAYFEAHFRRRALMKQASSVSQNGTDYQSSENDFSETMSYEYDNFGSFRERSHSAHFEYLVSGTVFEEPCSATERGTPYDDQNELQFIRPNSECDTPICDLENMQELQHDEVGNVNLMTNESETENLNTEVEKLDMSSKASSVSSNRHLVEGDNSVNTDHQTTAMIFDIVDLSARHPHDETVTTLSSEHEDDASSKEMAATSRPREKKSQPDGMKSGRTVVSTQGRRASSNVESRKAAENVSSKNIIGKHTKKEANELLRLKREKRAAESASPTTKPNYHNRVKQEVPQNSKTKPLHLNRSMDLDSRTKRTVNPLRPSYGNVAAKLNSNVNRPRQAFGSSRTGIKQNDSAFSFKSDERMVKRKEFLIKQDEKIHTKEAEMHQLQSKKEEKIEAENKQLRKRLNFKSTPIPSFYHDFHHGIIKSKGTPSNMKESTPVRRISMSETCERSPSFSEAKSERAPSSGEPLNKTRLQRDLK